MTRISELLVHARHELARLDETGATAVEYAIIVSLIAGVIIVVVALLGVQTDANFSKITDLLP